MYIVLKNSVHISRRTNSGCIINSNDVKLFANTFTLPGLLTLKTKALRSFQTSTGRNAEDKMLLQHCRNNLKCCNACLFWQSLGTYKTLCRRTARRFNVTAGGTQLLPGFTRLHGEADQTCENYRLHCITLAPISQKKTKCEVNWANECSGKLLMFILRSDSKYMGEIPSSVPLNQAAYTLINSTDDYTPYQLPKLHSKDTYVLEWTWSMNKAFKISRLRSHLDSSTSEIQVQLINFSVKLYFTVKGSVVPLSWGRYHKVILNFMIVFNTAHYCTASH